jgi:phosphoglycerate dehydrogenase-like enzyme
MMPTLLLLFKFKPDQVEQLRNQIPGWTILTGEAAQFSKDQLAEAEIVCGWHPAMAEALNSDCKLRWVQTSSAGIDNLPIEKLKSLGVHVTNASGIHPVSMAETLFAMLLSFSRNLHLAIRNQSKRQWKHSERYHQLAGQTMGIIGVGAIGTEIARLAGAFGMHTIGVRRSALPVPGVDKMYGMENLNEVLSLSDVVVNVLPYTAETRHLFDAGRFNMMKTNALFFNLGRGASVDTDALVFALENGVIGGAGLDVFETEPLPEDHPLWTLDNVIITPHIGGWTAHYKQLVADIFLHNLQAYLSTGKPDRNVVDFERNY